MRRRISLFFRKLNAVKDRGRVLRAFAHGKALQQGLPPPQPRSSGKRLLLIRLDDIGDYLLFRNQLAMYQKSTRWQQYAVTLLGNESWRDLFALLDFDAVDHTIWVNKKRYHDSVDYRLQIWRQLRETGFDTVVAPSRTRPLLLDDLCMLAAAAPHNIGCVNTDVHMDWNHASDALYSSLFRPSRDLLHEFQFNAEFSDWICGARHPDNRPRIAHRGGPPAAGRYIVCFVGGSQRSKRWPSERWIELIMWYRRARSSRVVLAGSGRSELEMARAIQRRTGAESLVGALTFGELLDWIAGAEAVVTNDTMAAHMGVALDRPTVIIANGIKYMRFAEYANAGVDTVATVYPEVFNQWRRSVGDGHYGHSETVSADIASIRADTVAQALEALISREQSSGMEVPCRGATALSAT